MAAWGWPLVPPSRRCLWPRWASWWACCYAQADGIGDTPLHLAARVHAWDVITLLYYEYEIEEELNDLDQYPFDHDCPLCPLKQFDLRKRILQL